MTVEHFNRKLFASRCIKLAANIIRDRFEVGGREHLSAKRRVEIEEHMRLAGIALRDAADLIKFLDQDQEPAE